MSLQPIKDAWHWLLAHLAPVPLEPDEAAPTWLAELAPAVPQPPAVPSSTAVAVRRRPGGLIGAIREAETELGLAAPVRPHPAAAAALRPVPQPRIPQLATRRAPQPGPAVPLPVWAAQNTRGYAGVYTARALPPAMPGTELVPVTYAQLHPDASYGARLAHLWKEHDARITLARGLVYNLAADHLKAFNTYARELTSAGAR